MKKEIDVTLYAEYQYKQAKALWMNGEGKIEVMRAWAVFVLSWQSFSGNIGSSWAFSDQRNCAKTFHNMKQLFDERYVRRLEQTQIFCRDACRVIESTDYTDTFFFCDPPYYNADMGSYDGYTKEDFEKLLQTLSKVFLLTTYPSDILAEYTERNGWVTVNNEMHLSASNKAGKNKTEVFTMNYNPHANELNLFV